MLNIHRKINKSLAIKSFLTVIFILTYVQCIRQVILHNHSFCNCMHPERKRCKYNRISTMHHIVLCSKCLFKNQKMFNIKKMNYRFICDLYFTLRPILRTLCTTWATGMCIILKCSDILPSTMRLLCFVASLSV